MKTKEQIIQEVINLFKDCPAGSFCFDCPFKEPCDEWDDIIFHELTD